jgi:hypothetical protein
MKSDRKGEREKGPVTCGVIQGIFAFGLSPVMQMHKYRKTEKNYDQRNG